MFFFKVAAGAVNLRKVLYKLLLEKSSKKFYSVDKCLIFKLCACYTTLNVRHKMCTTHEINFK